ncbi:hypothetical protein FN846DRAFT_909773 [Sphaerosporella brunnea]|uniref:Uncharacterized protein n=1 Tax=Sphaerosporella brunnea TaxID=1250544 RepID=A0A5J5ENJ9_9PEZI|nr:hypothetical protein FN846DRAFT_909773 [Sphaerosporella brunnea]
MCDPPLAGSVLTVVWWCAGQPAAKISLGSSRIPPVANNGCIAALASCARRLTGPLVLRVHVTHCDRPAANVSPACAIRICIERLLADAAVDSDCAAVVAVQGWQAGRCAVLFASPAGGKNEVRADTLP